MTADGARDATTAPAPDGLVVVDKPSGWTSHDVVGRVRRLAHTRRVGHAGTLDPMATGVLVVGIGRATRLLGHLTLADKAYDATIRLGIATETDDAAGSATWATGAATVTEDAVVLALAAFRGDIQQVPSRVSAIKVDGRRAYARVRAGEVVELEPRSVTVSQFDLVSIGRTTARVEGNEIDVWDLAVHVVCSSGTYVRALARDLGASLGVGGHLTSLRRTRVGPFDLTSARTLDELDKRLRVLPLDAVAAAMFVRRDIDAEAARGLIQGRPLAATGVADAAVAAFDPDGRLIALVRDAADGTARSLAVFVGPAGSGSGG